MTKSHRLLRVCSVFFMSLIAVLILAQEVEARGRGGGRGGRSGSGMSRGGSAQWGSMRGGNANRRGGSYRSGSHDRGSRAGSYDDRRSRSRSSSPPSRYDKSRQQYGSKGNRTVGRKSDSNSYSKKTRAGGSIDGSKVKDGNTIQREATLKGPGGESIKYSGSTTRTEDGISREGSFETSRGASGSGKADIEIDNKGVGDVERSRSGQTAKGETIEREISSERDGDWRVREGEIKTSTGVDAKTAVVFKKTDDGFIARGAFEGDDYAGAGTIVRDGKDVYRRGAITDGDDIRFGRTHCRSGACYGARATVDIDSYYYYPYYHYPYYYAYYSCPAYRSTVMIGYYGTPVYSCANVYVVSTTVIVSSYGSSNSGSGQSVEVQATSAPVVMYELEPSVVVYSTSYEPEGLYSVAHTDRYYWVPGVKKKSPLAAERIERAIEAKKPSANATVITYQVGDDLVYLTNEPPVDGIHAQSSDRIYAWIPGTSEPSQQQTDALATALTAHRDGGSASLEREVRKLQESRQPPTLPTS